MRCDEVQILLGTRRDLNMSQRAELDAHISGCRACAAARREEERTTRLLALLPSPNLGPPARVAAAVGGMATRRARAARLQHGLSLAGGLGAVVVLAAVLLNVVNGGLLFGARQEAQTAAQPSAPGATARPAVSAAAEAEATVYLIQTTAQRRQQLIAYEPSTNSVRFDAPLGTAPKHTLSDHSTGRTIEIRPIDVALSPDGRHIYIIERAGWGTQLVALSATDGAELWRSDLVEMLPHAGADGDPMVTVTPDGSRVLVQALSWGELPAGVPRAPSQPAPPALLSFDAATGRQLGEAHRLAPKVVRPLPLDRSSVLLFIEEWGIVDRHDLEGDAKPLSLHEMLVAGALLPDRRTVYALTPDLKLLTLDVAGGGLRVAAEEDLVPQGAFFFDHAAFSADGQTLAVAATYASPSDRPSPSGLNITSELRIFKARPWREVERRTYHRVVDGLGVSPAGEAVYAALGPEYVNEASFTAGPEASGGDPSGTLFFVTRPPVLVAVDTVMGRERTVRELEVEADGLLVGP